MIIGLLGMILFVGAIIAFAVNNINTPKNPKPVTPEEKKKRTERNLAIVAVGAAGIGAMKVGVDRMERRGNMRGYDLRPSGSSLGFYEQRNLEHQQRNYQYALNNAITEAQNNSALHHGPGYGQW